MAHNINAMVYAGATPWHGLGTQLPANGAWEDIREAAGFYTVEERDLFMPGRPTAIPDRKALVRADTGEYLSTVGDGYEVIQFDQLAEAGVMAAGDFQAIWHTAGTLGPTGIRGWMLGELPNPIRVKGDDSEIRKYVLLTTAHDGMRAAILKNVAERVVCQNTLGSALREQGAQWSIRHTKNAKDRIASAVEAFREVVTGYERFGELANALAAVRFTAKQEEAVVAEVLPMPDDGERHPGIEKNREAVRALHATFKGSSPAIRGTAWGALQAWTEWADWHRNVRALPADITAARFQANLLGASADLKARALDAILAQVRS